MDEFPRMIKNHLKNVNWGEGGRFMLNLKATCNYTDTISRQLDENNSRGEETYCSALKPKATN